RIVDPGADSGIQQSPLQGIAASIQDPHGEKMPGRFRAFRRFWQSDPPPAGKPLHISFGKQAPACVPTVEQGEAAAKESGLKLVEAGVGSLHAVLVLLQPAVVAKARRLLGEVWIVGQNGAAIAQRTPLLGGVEAEGGGMADESVAL